MPDAIVLRQITKAFGRIPVVRDLDLVVPGGALYGVIGPNSAGRTTANRMMLSILLPDRGEISRLGHRSALEAKDRIGLPVYGRPPSFATLLKWARVA